MKPLPRWQDWRTGETAGDQQPWGISEQLEEGLTGLFEQLAAVEIGGASDPDTDRVGVFWALLFCRPRATWNWSSRDGCIPLQLKRILPSGSVTSCPSVS